jgi:hypothetical protein
MPGSRAGLTVVEVTTLVSTVPAPRPRCCSMGSAIAPLAGSSTAPPPRATMPDESTLRTAMAASQPTPAGAVAGSRDHRVGHHLAVPTGDPGVGDQACSAGRRHVRVWRWRSQPAPA